MARGAGTLQFDVTDNGTIDTAVGQVKSFVRKVDKGTQRSMVDHAIQLRDEVRKNAQGAPGPRRITSGYWNSIKMVENTSGFISHTFTTSVISEHPAGPRLEKGYVGVDSLGRHYNQPPFPHWAPAIAKVGPEWLQEEHDKLPEWWKA